MRFNFLRWLRRCISSKGLCVPSLDIESLEDPEIVHRQAVVDAALRDAGVIHGADREWIIAELVRLKTPERTHWEVRLVVKDSEMEVWDRAEAFQITFLEQFRELEEVWGEKLPAVTWKFNSHQLPRQRTADVCARSLVMKDAPKVKKNGIGGPQVVPLALRDNAPDPRIGVTGELVV